MHSMRRAVFRMLVILILFALRLVFASNQVRADSPSCEQIKTACRNAGFHSRWRSARRAIAGLLRSHRPRDRAAQGSIHTFAGHKPATGERVPGRELLHPRRGACERTPAPAADGQTVYDPSLHVTWLADANLAGKQTFGVSSVHKDGSMDYATAIRWVAALNSLDHGAGYLGHHNWQLPTTPAQDKSCARTGPHGESFGFHCSGSALGSLYYASLGLREPNTAVRIPANKIGPFNDFQPYLYWSGSPAANPRQGFVSFSFNTGFQGANVSPNYLYVLPLIKGKLPGTPPAAGRGLQVNPGGRTVYDPVVQVTWLADANLAAKQTFGVAEIDPDGSMDHAAAVEWVAAMNKADQGRGYLGRTDWQLPETGPPDPSCSMKGTTGFDCTGSQMGELFYKQLGLRRGESVVMAPDVKVGAFHDIQPYLYWACEAETAASPCQADGPADGFEWNFSFGNGFQGTNLLANDLYVIVYYPGSPTQAPTR